MVKLKATWVEPVLEAKVDCTSETGDGLLREAVFKGMNSRTRRVGGGLVNSDAVKLIKAAAS